MSEDPKELAIMRIAQGHPGWDVDSPDDTPAMKSVRYLRRQCQGLSEKLNRYRRAIEKVQLETLSVLDCPTCGRESTT